MDRGKENKKLTSRFGDKSTIESFHNKREASVDGNIAFYMSLYFQDYGEQRSLFLLFFNRPNDIG